MSSYYKCLKVLVKDNSVHMGILLNSKGHAIQSTPQWVFTSLQKMAFFFQFKKGTLSIIIILHIFFHKYPRFNFLHVNFQNNGFLELPMQSSLSVCITVTVSTILYKMYGFQTFQSTNFSVHILRLTQSVLQLSVSLDHASAIDLFFRFIVSCA